MNNVILIGRTTREIELRYTTSQTAVARFSLAVERPVKDGEKKADFPNIIVFGKQAENCEKYLAKGRKVAVQGRLQTGSYEDKDGKRVYTTDVIAERVEFLEWANSDNRTEESQSEHQETVDDFKALDEAVPF
jgi:single-stranded DNA-binding protein 1|nr:MAG TPA: Single strand binding protein [Caudoviricetes sp.]